MPNPKEPDEILPPDPDDERGKPGPVKPLPGGVSMSLEFEIDPRAFEKVLRAKERRRKEKGKR